MGNRDCPLRYCLGYSSYILNRAGATDRVPPDPDRTCGTGSRASGAASGVELNLKVEHVGGGLTDVYVGAGS